ncbi:MAG: HypC/HybG/HupF family hydrogenase formation chaperone [Burkholderiales bacterium]|jgi:hydrogenase expression/formation protein HypC|nr:HypC/HybG/HupF family hydrogenase formation chaperone [Burkholderiales bacterium]MBP7521843.1 HypC/HybG/HupF family hydrogenase formation chaperone [Leptothrix sp. (in: b-proteobacteria)]
MCLAIPMCIVSIDDFSALCEARGQQRRVSLLPLFGESLAPGDWVQVHLDRAVQRMTAEDAAAAWEVFDLILAALEPAGAPTPATATGRSH